MFSTFKRPERRKRTESDRLAGAVLKSTGQGLFLLDAKDTVLPPVSQSLAALFRRQDFTDVTFEKLLGPVVTAKNLTLARKHMAGLNNAAPRDAAAARDFFADIDVRLPNPDGSFATAHYSFEFDPVDVPNEPQVWLVRVTDVTTQVHATRELEELRTQVQTQGEILRGVLQMGAARFADLMRKIDASMKTIGTVLKKPAREADAFRNKLEETLHEVDRVRREAAAFNLTALESAARIFEDALQELRSRSALSGSDFLPLAVKLDQLYDQFALMQSLTTASGPVREPDAAEGPRLTQNGTQVIEALKFVASMAPVPGAESKAVLGSYQTAPAGSLDSTLHALTDHVAHAHDKQVILESSGLQLVPQKYQAAVKNVAIQLIRNAVMHGIEPPAVREAAGKRPRGTLRLEFRLRDRNFELSFEDDGCGLVADQVRATAVARGVVTAEEAAGMRDREAIKLIFKSRYTTLDRFATNTTHGTGMALVRRYVHEAGGKVALASLPGRETRFKITLPAVTAANADIRADADAQTAAAPGAHAATHAQTPTDPQVAVDTHAVADAQAAADARAA
jgi:two-component system, chemotaxis family, sensor kinase CheA